MLQAIRLFSASNNLANKDGVQLCEIDIDTIANMDSFRELRSDSLPWQSLVNQGLLHYDDETVANNDSFSVHTKLSIPDSSSYNVPTNQLRHLGDGFRDVVVAWV